MGMADRWIDDIITHAHKTEYLFSFIALGDHKEQEYQTSKHKTNSAGYYDTNHVGVS